MFHSKTCVRVVRVAHLNSNVGNGKLGVVPLGQVTVLDLLDATGVGMDGLLFKISDKSVDNLGGDEVGDEKTVEEDALGSNDHHLHEPTRLAHLHECQEVHPLVVALLEERLDPTIVSLHASKASEVAQHAADHAWNSGDALQEDETHQLGLVSLRFLRVRGRLYIPIAPR